MKENEKRPYVKPEMEQVKLVPEEAVLAGCKTAAIIGPQFTGGCTDAALCLEQRS
jgi:hypothetical protein